MTVVGSVGVLLAAIDAGKIDEAIADEWQTAPTYRASRAGPQDGARRSCYTCTFSVYGPPVDPQFQDFYRSMIPVSQDFSELGRIMRPTNRPNITDETPNPPRKCDSKIM